MTSQLKFDKSNKQQDFQYMAREIESNKLIIGYIVVEKPWYSPESSWRYYIVSNQYSSDGFCGGSSDLGFNKVEVKGDTITAFNQIANISYNQESKIKTKLIGDSPSDVIYTIDVDDNIPFELWGN